MSKYTTEVRFLCESLYDGESHGFSDVDQIIKQTAPQIFDFAFPIFDEDYRLTLECKILRHYYTREISEETVGLWKLRLADKLNLIMPYYNKLYESELLNFNPFIDVDIKTAHNIDTEHSSSQQSGSVTGYNDSTIGSERGTDKNNKNLQTTTDESGQSVRDNDSEKHGNKSGSGATHNQQSNEGRTQEIGKDSKQGVEHATESSTDEKTSMLEGDKNSTSTNQNNATDTEIESAEKAVSSQDQFTNDGNRTISRVKESEGSVDESAQDDVIQSDTSKTNENSDSEVSTTEKSEQRDDNRTQLITKDTLSHTNDNWNLYSDTPQGSLTGMGGGWKTTGANAGDPVNGEVSYLTNATRVRDLLQQTDNKDHITTGYETRVGDRQADQTDATEREGTEEKESFTSKTASKEQENKNAGTEFDNETENKTGTNLGEKAEEDDRTKTGTHEEVTQGVELGQEKRTEANFNRGERDANKVDTAEGQYAKSGSSTSDTDSHEERVNKDKYFESETGYERTNDRAKRTHTETADGGANYDRYRDEEKTGGTRAKQTGRSRMSTTEEYVEKIFGKRGGITYSKMLTEFRETFLNIDLMIINDLRPLFFGLW